MRVILKPGGVVAVLLALGGLGILAARGNMKGEATPKPVTPSIGKATGTLEWGGMIGGTGTVLNGDFSGAFAPAKFFGLPPGPGAKPVEIKAHIFGEIADPWLDNSNWADVTARYAKEIEPDGNVCQKIQVDRVDTGRLQMIQFMRLNPSKSYRVTCRLRAKSPCSASLGFISLGADNVPQKDVTVTEQWQTFETIVTLPSTEYLFTVSLSQPATVVYLDDVRIEPTTPAKNALAAN